MEKIKYIVYTPDLENNFYIIKKKSEGITCISIIDARSAVYYATGICALNKETVMVCTSAGNESRSTFSGMTEAYYRNLPVVLVTFGEGLDYSTELNDVVFAHYLVNRVDDIDELLQNQKPMHIEVRECNWANYSEDVSLELLAGLEAAANSEDYMYFSRGAKITGDFKCKTVYGGMPGCKDGALANVLGASLAQKHRRYIGVLTEEEFIHDMNTLGNVNINDSLLYIVICGKENSIILNYSRSLHYEIAVQKIDVFSSERWTQLLSNSKKTVVEICRD